MVRANEASPPGLTGTSIATVSVITEVLRARIVLLAHLLPLTDQIGVTEGATNISTLLKTYKGTRQSGDLCVASPWRDNLG
jgi:hypothetical protein